MSPEHYNWVREHTWQARRQGDEPARLVVKVWRVPWWWPLLHRLGIV